MSQHRRHPMEWNRESRRTRMFRHFHANLCSRAVTATPLTTELVE